MKRFKAKPEEIYNFFYAKNPDPLQAMGLCYFAYGWGLLFLGCEIASFRFRKSALGPIDDSLLGCEAKRSVLDPALTDYLYFVWTKYSHYSGEELLERASRQPPYKNASGRIKKRDIGNFFKQFEKAAATQK